MCDDERRYVNASATLSPSARSQSSSYEHQIESIIGSRGLAARLAGLERRPHGQSLVVIHAHATSLHSRTNPQRFVVVPRVAAAGFELRSGLHVRLQFVSEVDVLPHPQSNDNASAIATVAD